MSATLTPLPSSPPGIPTKRDAEKSWNILPFPAIHEVPLSAPAAAQLPPFPTDSGETETQYPSTWPSPLAVLPAIRLNTAPPADFLPDPLFAFPDSSQEQATPDYTDEDLLLALSPIMDSVVGKALRGTTQSADPQLEPMLRATIRRALAEYAPASRPFQPPGVFDRFIWHLKALFTSRTYEDILFEKTRRFQVEETFLLDIKTLALISFASCDPARHSSARRVSGTAQRLALQVRDEDGNIQKLVQLSDHRFLISREGTHVLLMTLVRGRPGDMVVADLDFALRRIESQFGDKFDDQGSPMLFELQPFLEDCLLIQSAATAA